MSKRITFAGGCYDRTWGSTPRHGKTRWAGAELDGPPLFGDLASDVERL